VIAGFHGDVQQRRGASDHRLGFAWLTALEMRSNPKKKQSRKY
jgi:hypothetical protein